MNEVGGDPVGLSSEDFSARVRAEIDRWNKMAKTTGIKPR
jgi:hypothetical protein